MHPSALNFGKLFFQTYCGGLKGAVVHDVGAQNVNGSLHDVCPPHLGYVGVDFVDGRGVDIVLDDPYKLPFDDSSLDIIVSSSCFEHSQFFWLIFLEMLRVLKPGGLLYVNVPSNGSFHQYPVDCWRFYPDAGEALEAWARHEGYQCKLLESFVGEHSSDSFVSGGAWNDFVAIFVKDKAFESQFAARIQDQLPTCWNGVNSRSGGRNHPGFLSPDHEKLAKSETSIERLHEEIAGHLDALAELREQSEKKDIAIFAAQSLVDEILRSRSWQITAPVRWLSSKIRKVKTLRST